MRSLRVSQLIYRYNGDGEITETYFKNAYIDVDSTTSFEIEEAEEVQGEMVKPFFIGCGGISYSVMPEPHVYEIMRERFIKNAITE